MNSRYIKQNDTYKPNHLQLMGLALKSARFKPVMFKWLAAIIGIVCIGIGGSIELRRQYWARSQEGLSFIGQMGMVFGLVEPSVKQDSSIRLKEDKLHILDGTAKLYLELDENLNEAEDKSDNPWILQGLSDDILSNPENRKSIKKWISSLKQEIPAEEP